MSLKFRTLQTLLLTDFCDGRLDAQGVRQALPSEAGQDDSWRCLTDGSNFLWLCVSETGEILSFTSWALNGDPRKIVEAIREVFDVTFVSEHEPEYWGFKTREDWVAAWKTPEHLEQSGAWDARRGEPGGDLPIPWEQRSKRI